MGAAELSFLDYHAYCELTLKVSSESDSASLAGKLFHSGIMVRVDKECCNSSVLVRWWNSFQGCKAWSGRRKLAGLYLLVLTLHSHEGSCTSWWAWRISCGQPSPRVQVHPASMSHFQEIVVYSPVWLSRQFDLRCILTRASLCFPRYGLQWAEPYSSSDWTSVMKEVRFNGLGEPLRFLMRKPKCTYISLLS